MLPGDVNEGTGVDRAIYLLKVAAAEDGKVNIKKIKLLLLNQMRKRGTAQNDDIETGGLWM